MGGQNRLTLLSRFCPGSTNNESRGLFLGQATPNVRNLERSQRPLVAPVGGQACLLAATAHASSAQLSATPKISCLSLQWRAAGHALGHPESKASGGARSRDCPGPGRGYNHLSGPLAGPPVVCGFRGLAPSRRLTVSAGGVTGRFTASIAAPALRAGVRSRRAFMFLYRRAGGETWHDVGAASTACGHLASAQNLARPLASIGLRSFSAQANSSTSHSRWRR